MTKRYKVLYRACVTSMIAPLTACWSCLIGVVEALLETMSQLCRNYGCEEHALQTVSQPCRNYVATMSQLCRNYVAATFVSKSACFTHK